MAQVNMYQNKKDDPLTTIGKALGIAASIYGIRTDSAKLEQYQKENEAKEAETARVSSGKLNKTELINLSKTHDISTVETPGSIRIGSTESDTPLFASIRKIQTATKTIDTGTGTALVDAATGEVIKSFPKARASGGGGSSDGGAGKLVAVDTVDEAGNPVRKFVRPTEGAIFPTQKPAGKDRPPTQLQAEAVRFGKNMEAANQEVEKLYSRGYDRTSKRSGIMSSFPSFAQPADLQLQTNAENQFINNLLRDESGATIGDEERAEKAKELFPRAGDSAEVVENKRLNRLQQIATMKALSGSLWESVPTVKPKLENPEGSWFEGTATAAPESSAKPWEKYKK